MDELAGVDQWQTIEERWAILRKSKRKNLDKLKRTKRVFVKAKLEKKRINRDIKKLQAEWQELIRKDPAKAKSAFANELENVSTEDMFPKDLEKEFDKLELRNIKQGRTMKTEDLSDDKDLKHVTPSAVEAFERELKEDLDEHESPAPLTLEATEPDDDTKAQLDDSGSLGLTEGDIFIGEDGQEEEVIPHDENNNV
jgi:chromosome segregation ATPase